MAQKTERPIEGSATARVKIRWGNWLITGGAGAVGTKSEAWFSVVRNSAGNYTVTLDDRFVTFLYAHFAAILASGFGACRIDSQSTVNNKATLVIITSATGGGAAADLAAGAQIMFEAVFKDSVAT